MPVVLLGSMLTSGSAFAASATVDSKAALTTAFSHLTSGDTVTLAADLVGDGGTDDVLTVPANTSVSLNLSGHELDLDQVVLSSNSTLTVVGANSIFFPGSASPSGRLVVGTASVASGDTGATGIVVGQSASLTASNARVTAVGSTGRAGIGSAPQQGTAGAVSLQNGSVVEATGGKHGAGIGGGERAVPARVLINSSTVRATGGTGGAGIGGGYANLDGSATNVFYATTSAGSDGGGDGAAVVARGGAGAAGIGGGQADPLYGGGASGVVSLFASTVSAADGGLAENAGTGAVAPNAVGAGQDGASPGTLLNRYGTLRIPVGAVLNVPSGTTIENTNYGTIEVAGALTGTGTIDNSQGNLRATGAGRIADDDLEITGNNWLVTLDPGDGTTTVPAPFRVYANSLAASGRTLSDYSGTLGEKALVGWSMLGSEGGTQQFDDGSYLAYTGDEHGAVTVRAVYELPIVFGAAALPHAVLGQGYDQTVPFTGAAARFQLDSGDSEEESTQDVRLPVSGAITNLPVGMSIDTSTGRITGYPGVAGHYVFQLTGISDYQRVTQTFTLNVAGVPTIATSDLPNATVGTAYSVPVIATSVGDSGPVRYTIAGGALPAGMRLDPATGVLSGTPTASGAFTFGLKATNDYGSTKTALTLTIEATTSSSPTPAVSSSSAPNTVPSTTSPATAPVLPAISPSRVKVGHPITLSVAASSSAAVSYSVPATDLPRGLRLDSTTGVISGAPASHGRFVLHVTATSSAGSSTQEYRLVVPAPKQAVKSHVSAVTPASGQRVKVAIRGLKAGEKWEVQLDGHQVKTGTARFGGTVIKTIALPRTAKDTVHVIEVSGNRTNTDPAVLTSDTSRVTTVATQKTLSVTYATSRITVRKLAAQERVTIKLGGKVIAAGRADSHGTFIATVKKVSGKHTYTVTGSSKHRTNHITIG